MIEMQSESYNLATYCKRVSLMDKDLIVIRRFSYMFCMLLDLVPLKYMETINVLNILAFKKKKGHIKNLKKHMNEEKDQDLKKSFELR